MIPLYLFWSFAKGTRRVHSLTRRVGSGFRARVSWRLGESIFWTRRVCPSGRNPKSPGCPLFKPPYSPQSRLLHPQKLWENPNSILSVLSDLVCICEGLKKEKKKGARRRIVEQRFKGKQELFEVFFRFPSLLCFKIPFRSSWCFSQALCWYGSPIMPRYP